MIMEEMKPKLRTDLKEQEIVFSKSIKAGKRIYYLDVKRNRKDDLFVAITESKKIVSGFEENAQVSYEKHKIFLYKEDFDKFIESLQDVISFIRLHEEEDVKEESNHSILEEVNISASSPAPVEFNIDEFEK
jgi:hypothetical protein